MKLVNMRRTKAEKREREDRYARPVPVAEDYHHGLHVELDHDGMEKLGLHETPKPGSGLHGEFRGRVTHASEERDEDGTPRRTARVLLHHMAVKKNDGDEDDRAKRRATIEAAAAKTK